MYIPNLPSQGAFVKSQTSNRTPGQQKPVSGRHRFLSGAHRKSTRRIGEALWQRLKDGEAVVNLSQLAEETGYSRPTIYRAICFFTRFGKLLPVEDYRTGNGQPGRAAMYRLNPAYTAETKSVDNPEPDAGSSKRVNPLYKTPKKDLEPLKAAPANPVGELTTWLKSVGDSNCPSNAKPAENCDKRRLCALTRVLAPKPVADAICAQIWHRGNTSYGTWKAVLRALWNGSTLPQELENNPQELTWRVRSAIKRVADGEACETFTELLADERQPGREEQLKRELQRNRQREKGRKALWQWYKTEVEQTGCCPYCGQETTLAAILDANLHPCSGWFFRLREELAEARVRLADELFAAHELKAAKALRNEDDNETIPQGLLEELAGEVFETVTLHAEVEFWNAIRREERRERRKRGEDMPLPVVFEERTNSCCNPSPQGSGSSRLPREGAAA